MLTRILRRHFLALAHLCKSGRQASRPQAPYRPCHTHKSGGRSLRNRWAGTERILGSGCYRDRQGSSPSVHGTSGQHGLFLRLRNRQHRKDTRARAGLQPAQVAALRRLYGVHDMSFLPGLFPCSAGAASSAGGFVDAFPVVEGTAVSSTNGYYGATSHTVALPSGIQAGELLIVLMSVSSTPSDVINTPSGWTALLSSPPNARGRIFYKVASGAEGASVSVSTSSSVLHASCSYRISNYAFIEGDAAAGSNSPNLQPSWGIAKTLWIISLHGSFAVLSGMAPSGYGFLLEDAAGLTISAGIASARRELEAASEDPGGWPGTGSMAATIAISPALQ